MFKTSGTPGGSRTHDLMLPKQMRKPDYAILRIFKKMGKTKNPAPKNTET